MLKKSFSSRNSETLRSFVTNTERKIEKELLNLGTMRHWVMSENKAFTSKQYILYIECVNIQIYILHNIFYTYELYI